MSKNAAMDFINGLREDVDLYDRQLEIGSVDEMYHKPDYEEACISNYYCDANNNKPTECHGPHLHI